MTRRLPAALVVAALGCGGGRDLRGDADAAADATDPDVAEDAATDRVDTAGWECEVDEDCDDADPCTTDACDPDSHACVHGGVEGLAILGPEVQVTDGPYFSGFSDLVWTGSDAAVLWYDGRHGPCADEPGPTLCNYELYVKRVGFDGTEVTPETRISTNDMPCDTAMGAWTGSELGVVWSCGTFLTSSRVFFRRVGADGTLLGDEVELLPAVDNPTPRDLVWTGSEYVAFWERGFIENRTMMARMDAAGVPIGDGIELSRAINPAAVWTGSDLGIAWKYRMESPDTGIQIVRVSPEGVLTAEIAGIGSINSDYPAVGWTGSDLWVSWIDHGDPPGFPYTNGHVFLSRVTMTGEVLGVASPLTPSLGNYFLQTLVWTGSEMDVSWAELSGWERPRYISRFDPAGARLEPDIDLGIYLAEAWTGAGYVLAGDDERDGVGHVFLNRLGLCE